MKVCNLTSVHSRYDIRIFHKQCWAQSLRGEAHLIVADGQKDEIKDNIHIHGVKKYKNRFLRMILAVFAVYKRAKTIKADVYILHDPELLTIALLLKKTGAKVFFDSHECYTEALLDSYWIPPFLRKHVVKIYRYIESLILSRLDGVIAATKHIGDVLSEYNKNIFVLHNYALLKEFADCTEPDIEHSNHILYCGGISQERNIINIVKALSLCRNDIKLILCGTFSSEALLKQCQQLSGWSQVEYKGQVSRQQLHSLAQKCFCGVCVLQANPAHKYALGLKIFEYPGMHLPLVASNFDLWKKIIGNENKPFGVFINPANPQEIADAIDKFYENKALTKQLGQNGRKAVETKYNFELEKEKYLNFLEKFHKI